MPATRNNTGSCFLEQETLKIVFSLRNHRVSRSNNFYSLFATKAKEISNIRRNSSIRFDTVRLIIFDISLKLILSVVENLT